MSSNQLILCCPSSSCFQSFWALGSFLMSQLFTSGDQSIGASVLSSVLPMSIQDWFLLVNWFIWSPFSFKSLLQHPSSKASILWRSAFSHPALTSIHDYWKNHSFDYINLCWQRSTLGQLGLMSLIFNMLSRLVITLLPRSKHLLISWLQSPSAVISELPQIKSVTVSTVSPSICHEVMGPDAMILADWKLSFKLFQSSLSPSWRGCFIPLCFLP